MPDREALGRIVRRVWVECASEDPASPPHHLTGWDGLDERNKEIDRRIGEAVAAEARSLTDSERFQIQEARDTLARWDEDRGSVGGAFGGYDTERVLADHLRAVLALIPEGATDG